MSNVYFNSDLHLGHRKVITFHDDYRAKAMGVSTIEEHDQMIFDLWNDTIKKRDTIYLLGDIGYNLEPLKSLPGIKKLLLGNHDTHPVAKYLEWADDIIGPIKYKRHWLNHFPPVEQELYGKPVIHGHTHSQGINDPRYINVCVEMNGGHPVPFEKIKSGEYTTWEKVNKPYQSS